MRVDKVKMQIRSWQLNIFVLATLITLVFAVYGWYANNPYVMDDVVQIQENRLIRSFDNLGAIFSSSTMENGGAERASGIYYKPLMTTYFATFWALGGKDGEIWILRIPLFILQAFSAFFIFLLSLEFLTVSLACAGALLFLLHPVNAEMILYLADAQDVLYLFFGLLLLVLMTKLKQRSLWLTGFGSLICITCALLSKETGALFIPIGLLWAWIVNRKAVWPLLVASLLVIFAYVYVRTSIGLIETRSHVWLLHQIGFWQRLSMVPLILAHDIEILLVPIRISLGTDFVLKELSITNFVLPLVVVSIFASFWWYWARSLVKPSRHRSFFYFFISVIFLWFCLHGQVLLPLDAVYADRWLCLPVWAFTSLSLLTYQSWLESNKLRSSQSLPSPVFSAIVIAILCLYIVRDLVRAEDFTSPIKLYAREAELHPWDAIMANNVGVELFKAGQWFESERHFAKATEINPGWSVAWNNLGAVAERHQDYQRALDHYKKAMTLDNYGLAVENYAKLLFALGRMDECRIFLKDSLSKFPYNYVLRKLANETALLK